MLQLLRPIVFMDFETTGTNTEKDKIVEMACVKLMPNGDRTVKTYRINPIIPIPEGATKVHGITNEMVKDAPTFKQLSKGMLEYISGCDLAGFKSNTFDFPMLYSEFLNAGIEWDYSKHNFIDVGNIFQIQEPRTLSAAVKFYCGKVLEDAHSAEADILATIDVFEKQINCYPDLPNTIQELDIFCNFGSKRLDMSGKFAYADDGETVIFNFGPSKGKPAKNDYGFLKWMVFKADFAPDTVAIAKKLMNEIPIC